MIAGCSGVIVKQYRVIEDVAAILQDVFAVQTKGRD